MTPTTNWTARMIAAPETIKSAPRLRYEFAIDEAHGAVVNARLALSALGIVYAWLNSVEVNDDMHTVPDLESAKRVEQSLIAGGLLKPSASVSGLHDTTIVGG